MDKLHLLSAGALTALLAACSSSDLADDPGKSQDLKGEGTYYISVVINGDSNGTRSADQDGKPIDTGDFDPGDENESKVNRAFFVFYDIDGNIVGDVAELDLGTATTTGLSNTVEARYEAVVPVSVRQGEYKPDKVVCYINPISTSSLQQPLNTMMTAERTDYKLSDGTFPMSSSAYYEGTGSTEPIYYAKIPTYTVDGVETLALFSTQAEAEAELNNTSSTKVVQVYVERYASKLSFQSTTPTDYTGSTRVYTAGKTYVATTDKKDVTLTFVPEKWALNAVANTVYTIKSFRQESESGLMLSSPYSYSTLNAKIIEKNNLAWEWNNATYHRSYWGMSPAYFTSNYPTVSSEAKTFMANNTLHQTYLSYSDVTGSDGFDVQTERPTPQYFRPTTVGRKALDGANPAAAVPSVLLVGKYTLKIAGTEANIPDGKGFYTYSTDRASTAAATDPATASIYFDDKDGSAGESCVTGGGSMLMRFISQQKVLYSRAAVKDDQDQEKKDSEGNTIYEYTLLSYANTEACQKLLANLEVAVIDQSVLDVTGKPDDPLKLQANARSLQLKSGTTSQASGIYIATPNGYREIVANSDTELTEEQKKTQVTLADANAQLMQSVGYAYYYKAGMAYFSIPVKHLGFYRTNNPNIGKDKIEWSYVNVGDFGMVRNHSYRIVVDQITGLASGIANETDPIVPPATTTDYYVAYSVNILKWALTPEQHVKL